MYVRISATDHEGHKVTKLNQLHLAIDTDSGTLSPFSPVPPLTFSPTSLSADRGLGYQVELLLPICESAVCLLSSPCSSFSSHFVSLLCPISEPHPSLHPHLLSLRVRLHRPRYRLNHQGDAQRV
jgi:hypothetical protein